MPFRRSVINVYLQNTGHAMLSHTKFQDADTVICRSAQCRTPSLELKIWWNLLKSFLKVCPKTTLGRRKRKKMNENYKAFSVKPKRNSIIT